MFKDLVVPLTDTGGDASAVAAAVAIAGWQQAHLSLLEFANMPTMPASPWGSGEIGIGEIYERFRESAESDAAAWRERLAKQAVTLSSEVRVVDSLAEESPRLAALHARYADLAVMTMAAANERDVAIVRDFFASLLLDSGRPLLLVPPGFEWRPAKRVVVAWRPRREAARALHDAMPFLRAAETVDVMEVEEGGDGALQGADIAAHLARHGLNVNVFVRPWHEESVALTLVRHAQDHGAELLVAGGYGHSRLREWVMGGVTRDLLSGDCPIPVFFSH